jgi:hypothetical protein
MLLQDKASCIEAPIWGMFKFSFVCHVVASDCLPAHVNSALIDLKLAPENPMITDTFLASFTAVPF